MGDLLASAQKYWWLITGPVTVALAVALLWLRTQFATKTEFGAQSEQINGAISKLAKRIDEHAETTDHRLTQLEAATEHLPTREAMHQLALQVERQGGAIEAMRDAQRATAAGVARIEDYMIRAGGTK